MADEILRTKESDILTECEGSGVSDGRSENMEFACLTCRRLVAANRVVDGGEAESESQAKLLHTKGNSDIPAVREFWERKITLP